MRRSERLPLPLRAVRVAHVTAHVMRALATTAVVFPFIGVPRRQRLIRAWCLRLLRILRVEARIHGLPEGGLPGNLLIVANHISWLDIFVLNTVQPARFVAKAELARWPLVGRLVTGVGTLYIERERRRDTHKVNRHAADVLAAGDVVAVFPEGTTSDGRDVLPFHGSLLQPIVDAEGHVQPVAIRYRDAAGLHSDAPAYVGETSFMQSFWRVTGERALVVELHLAEPLPARARHRRELSRAAEAAIRTALASPSIGPAPDKPGGRRA
ncbi:MAG: lysophospholipid acyltransferase family protein [Betaproteobacteria bacterium]